MALRGIDARCSPALGRPDARACRRSSTGWRRSVGRVLAAALTRDELTWPADRLPATPSYELSGVVARRGGEVEDVAIGDEVFALTPFDRDGPQSLLLCQRRC